MKLQKGLSKDEDQGRFDRIILEGQTRNLHAGWHGTTTSRRKYLWRQHSPCETSHLGKVITGTWVTSTVLILWQTAIRPVNVNWIVSRNYFSTLWIVDRDSSVGIATDYGLDDPGSNTGGKEIFRTCPDRPWGPPSLLYNRYRVFPGGKVRPGRAADHSPPSSAAVIEQ